VAVLVGDATRAREKLGWKPTIGFRELIEMMVDADLETEKRNPGTGRELTAASTKAR
jgi:GDPmannose 4,6-dehydratase